MGGSKHRSATEAAQREIEESEGADVAFSTSFLIGSFNTETTFLSETPLGARPCLPAGNTHIVIGSVLLRRSCSCVRSRHVDIHPLTRPPPGVAGPSEALAALRNLPAPGGGTALYEAVRRAVVLVESVLADAPSTFDPNLVVIKCLTDGCNTARAEAAHDAHAAVARLRQRDAVVSLLQAGTDRTAAQVLGVPEAAHLSWADDAASLAIAHRASQDGARAVRMRACQPRAATPIAAAHAATTPPSFRASRGGLCV
eukprot:5194392-Prymnesium_polylepis.1